MYANPMSGSKTWKVQDKERARSMTTQEQIANTVLKRNDIDYFKFDEEMKDDISWKMLKTMFSGIAINGPAQINTNQYDKLPIILGRRSSSARNYSFMFRDNCTLVLCDLLTGKVQAKKPFPEKEPVGLITPVKVSPATDNLTFTADVYLFDLKELFEIEWEEGRYSVNALSYDWFSNTVFTELKGKKKEGEETELKIFPKPNPLSGGVTTSWIFPKKPKEAFPSYEKFKDVTPPQKEGGNFIISTKSNKSIVYGSFKIESKAFHILDKPQMLKLSGNKTRKAIAIIPVTLLFLKRDMPVPIQFDWGIPIYGNERVQPGSILEGQFAIDIIKEYKSSLPPDMYMGYMVLDGKVYGPRPFEWNP